MMPLRVAVVGCGYWAPNIVRNLAGLDNVDIVALCDYRREHAQALAARLASRATVVTDHRRLCETPTVDAAFIVMPIRTHFAIARDFLASGKHVFVEKPLAATVEECAELIALADTNRRVLVVGHVFEYNAAVNRIKQYLDSGELGRLFYIYSQRVNLGRIQSDINALWSFPPHDISIINYWLGAESSTVTARGLRCLGHNVEDTVFALLEYPGGIGVHLHLWWLDPRKIRQMTLVGSRKMLVYDDVSLEHRIQIYDKEVNHQELDMRPPGSFAEFQYEIRMGDLVIPQFPFSEPLQEECRHFAECARTGARPRTDGHNGLRVVRALQAAQRSLENGGTPVEIAAVGAVSA